MFPMMERCHIYGKKNCEGPEGWENDDNAPWYDPKGKYGPEIKGAIANGYTPEEMKHYFEYIAGFSSYCFNRSHAAAYSYISVLTAWLKHYHPVEYFAAYLSLQDINDLIKYIPVVESYGIKVKAPNINQSNEGFTPVGNEIVFGLGSIKGVGYTVVGPLVENRPYTSLVDMLQRLPKKVFNKRVGQALIQSGALDSFNTNRYELLNEFHNLRKDKDDRYVSEDFNDNVIMEMEVNTLNCPVTITPEWYTLENGKVEGVECIINSVNERKDRNGNLMAFATVDVGGGALIDVLIFSSVYLSSLSMVRPGTKVKLDGTKDSNSKMVVKAVHMAV